MTQPLQCRLTVAALFASVATTMACTPRQHTLTVSAAASLTDAFIEIAQSFEAAYPGQPVDLNLAASGVLAQQIRQGASVDVFASASAAVMDDLEAEALLVPGSRRDIASNRVVVVTGLEGPQFSDAEEIVAASRVAIGNPELVPAGTYARESLQSLDLWAELEDQLVYGENVRQVLAWVEQGEVPVGVVFATDAQSSQRVRIVTMLPADSHEPILYPIAVIRGTGASGGASDFVAFVVGPEGQAILARHGFLPVPAGEPGA